jgi:hypothetical protein
MEGVIFMDLLLWIFKLLYCGALVYIGWLCFDFFLNNRKKGGRK